MGKRISALFCFGEDHELLGITGTLQVEDGVVHIVAEKLWRPTLELKPSGQPPGPGFSLRAILFINRQRFFRVQLI